MLINLRNALMAGKRLPYDAEVEFLESTGTQWIDTGYAPTATTKLEINLMFTGTGTQQFGSGRSASGVWAILFGYYQSKIAFWGGVTQLTRLSSYTTNQLVTCGFSVPDQTYWIGDNAISDTTIGTPTTTVQTFALFARKNADNTFASPCTMRAYSGKIWDNGTLVRDLIPVRKGSVGYLYDRVSGKLFGNAGTGDFVVGQDVVPVEYIESHGTEYIDTGLPGVDGYTFKADFMFTSLYSSYNYLAGSGASSSNRIYFTRKAKIGGSQNSFRLTYNDSPDTSYQGVNVGEWASVTSIAEQGHQEMILDGETVYTATVNTPVNTGGNIYLFCSYYPTPGTTGEVAAKLRSAQFIYNNVPVRSFFPVRVGQEGAMMDVLTRRVYRNAGTGAFGYGNDLKYPIPA